MFAFNSILLVLVSTASVMLAAPTTSPPSSPTLSAPPKPTYKATLWLRPVRFKSVPLPTGEPVEDPYKLYPMTEVAWTYQLTFPDIDKVVTISPQRRGGSLEWELQQDNSLPFYANGIKLGELEFDSEAWREFYLLGGQGTKGKFAMGRIRLNGLTTQTAVLFGMVRRLQLEGENGVTFTPEPAKVPKAQWVKLESNLPGYSFRGYLLQELEYAEIYSSNYDHAEIEGKAFDSSHLYKLHARS
ncbi:hypothetical protein FB446DRAFT_323765 [Lentinula raphanica]|nr:hypothetical protein FB446DRAFT_323765 [Lentinula raphanica]